MERSDAAFRKAAALYEAVADHAGLSQVLGAEGGALRRTGDMNGAVRDFERAVAEAKLSGDAAVLAQVSITLATGYRLQASFADSIRILEQTQRSLAPGSDKVMAQVQNALAGVYYDDNDLDLAISANLQALALKEKLHAAPNEIGRTAMNLGLCYQKRGDFKTAIPYFDRSVQLLAANGDPSENELVTYNYGIMLHKMHRRDEAKEKLETALAIAEKISDRRLATSARIELAEIAVDQGQFKDAAALAVPSVQRGREQHEPRTLVRAADVLGVALQFLDRAEEAEATLDEAIRTVEQSRDELPGDRQGAARFLAGEVDPYHHMVQLQLRNGHPDKALAYAERIKARALLDILQTGRVSISKTVSEGDRRQEAELSGSVVRANEVILQESRRTPPDRARQAEAERALEKARLAYRSFEVALYAAHPQLRVQRVAFEPVAPAELVGALPTAIPRYSNTSSPRRRSICWC